MNENVNNFYDKAGYDKYGYNISGLDINGLDPDGYDKKTAQENREREKYDTAHDNSFVVTDDEVEMMQMEAEIKEQKEQEIQESLTGRPVGKDCVVCGEPATEWFWFDAHCDSCYISESA